jgi:TRAP-type C4-dicarboxylate transport system substrate-binding protein
MKKMRLVTLAILSTLMVVFTSYVTEAAAAEKVIEWKQANHTSPTSYATSCIKSFFDHVEQLSKGTFKCQHFWNETLAKATDQPSGIQNGLFQATCYFPGYYPSKLPLYNLATLPALFPTKTSREDYLTFVKILNEWDQTDLLKAEFAKFNAIPICEMQPPERSIMGKVRIATYDDLKGKKLYAPGGTGDLLKKAGVAPSTFSAVEVYDALDKGVIEGVAHNFAIFIPYKIYEISQYWTEGIVLGETAYCLVVSKTAYDALPSSIKNYFDEAKAQLPKTVADTYWDQRTNGYELFSKDPNRQVVKFAAEGNKKLREEARIIWKENVDKLEKEGIPAKQAFNSLQNIIRKYVSSYEPYLMN